MRNTSKRRFLFGGSPKQKNSMDTSAISVETETSSRHLAEEREREDRRREEAQRRESERIHEIEDADRSFFNNDFDEAIALYLSAIPIAQERLPLGDPTIGDINVKISTILQGRGELQPAIDHLTKAKDVYKTSYNMFDDDGKGVIGQKIVEIATGFANLYVDMGEMDNASTSYEDAIESCRTYFPKDEQQLANALNNHANFLSICLGDHETALTKLKEALKVSLEAANGKMNVECATTLNNMGRVYMRRTKPSNTTEAHKDAKRAEVCFVRAVQLYRMALVKSGSDKVTETLYNLSQAREWQAGGKKGILRNVRFEPQPVKKEYTDIISSDSSDEESFASTVVSEVSNTHGFGFASFFRCGDSYDLSVVEEVVAKQSLEEPVVGSLEESLVSSEEPPCFDEDADSDDEIETLRSADTVDRLLGIE